MYHTNASAISWGTGPGSSGKGGERRGGGLSIW